MLPVSDVNAVALPLRRRDEHSEAVEERTPKRGRRAPGSAGTEWARDLLTGVSAPPDAGTGLPRRPRIGGLSCSTSGDLHSEFAGLRAARNVSGSRGPAFANSRVFGADVYDDERAKVAARLASGGGCRAKV
jgi:hypothetical protein